MSKRGSPICAMLSGKLPCQPSGLTRNSKHTTSAVLLRASTVMSYWVVCRQLLNRIFVILRNNVLTKYAANLLKFGLCYVKVGLTFHSRSVWGCFFISNRFERIVLVTVFCTIAACQLAFFYACFLTVNKLDGGLDLLIGSAETPAINCRIKSR